MLATFIFFLFTLFFIYKSKFFEVSPISKQLIVVAYLIKLVFAALLYSLYTFYYTDLSKNDIYKYYTDSKVLVDLFYHSPKDFFSFLNGNELRELKLIYWEKTNSYGFFNDNKTLILFQTFLGIVTFKSIGVNFVVFTFISFSSIFALIKCFEHFQLKLSKLTFFLFFFFPSVLLWSSGPTKESLILSSINIIVYQLVKYNSSKKIVNLFLGIFFLFCLLISKNYMFGLFVIAAGVYILWILLPKIPLSLTGFLYTILLLFSIFIIDLVHPALKGIDFEKKKNEQRSVSEQKKLSGAYQLQVSGKTYNLLNTLSFKQRDNLIESHEENANSIIAINKINGSFLNFLIAFPIAIWNVLFFPSCPSVFIGFKAIYYLENTFLLMLLFYSVYNYNRSNHPNLKKMTTFLFLFSFLVFAFQGMITPVLGNLYRYKSVVIPVLCFALILSSNAKLFFSKTKDT